MRESFREVYKEGIWMIWLEIALSTIVWLCLVYYRGFCVVYHHAQSKHNNALTSMLIFIILDNAQLHKPICQTIMKFFHLHNSIRNMISHLEHGGDYIYTRKYKQPNIIYQIWLSCNLEQPNTKTLYMFMLV